MATQRVGAGNESDDETRSVKTNVFKGSDTSPAATMMPLMVANGFLSGPNLKKKSTEEEKTKQKVQLTLQ